ncbi:MAG: hypothetical protein ACOCWG_01790 [bacterium]
MNEKSRSIENRHLFFRQSFCDWSGVQYQERYCRFYLDNYHYLALYVILIKKITKNENNSK